MDTPGVRVSPLTTMAGVDEFCETFFDGVRVPAERMLGAPGQGWAVAQHILSCERGPIFWQRGGWLAHHLGSCAAMTDSEDESAVRSLGQAYADLFALRARSRRTQHALAEGRLPGAESSVDKVLIAIADQRVFDTSRAVLGGAVELDDGPLADRFRKEWLYSRAATIYGGTSEIQRDIIAGRLLDLPRPP
jgi:alkylation response protein AidB-like acyl-CoA dehydrogenase